MPQHRPISLYWKCQIIGWCLAGLYWQYLGFASANFSLLLAAMHFIGDVIIYISITHTYRSISKKFKWHQLPFQSLMIRLVPAIIILALAYMIFTATKLYAVNSLFDPQFNISFKDFYQAIYVNLFLSGIRWMAVWLLAYYLYHYAQREIKTIRENAKLSVVAREAQLNNLTSQLNPHFFFNSLNSIKGLVAEDPEQARRAIDLLSDLLRTSLYERDTLLISLREELGLVKDYLELEKLRFEERLHFTIDIPENLLLVPVVPFSIQTLVENAVKYGISTRQEGGTIKIAVSENEHGLLSMTVQSPGNLKASNKEGVGLKNLRERLKLQFNDKAMFNLSASNDTVLATILIPAA